MENRADCCRTEVTAYMSQRRMLIKREQICPESPAFQDSEALVVMGRSDMWQAVGYKWGWVGSLYKIVGAPGVPSYPLLSAEME